jgi:hypothetical protein
MQTGVPIPRRLTVDTIIWTRRRKVARGESWTGFACVSCGAPFDDRPALVVLQERFELGFCERCAGAPAPDALKIALLHTGFVGRQIFDRALTRIFAIAMHIRCAAILLLSCR